MTPQCGEPSNSRLDPTFGGLLRAPPNAAQARVGQRFKNSKRLYAASISIRKVGPVRIALAHRWRRMYRPGQRCLRRSPHGSSRLPPLSLVSSLILVVAGAICLLSCSDDSRHRAAQEGVNRVQRVLDIILHPWDWCPGGTIQDLVQSRKLEPSMAVDPWGEPYRIECHGDVPRAYSNGPDRTPGTADDVASTFGLHPVEETSRAGAGSSSSGPTAYTEGATQ